MASSELIPYRPQSSLDLAPDAWKLAEKIANTDFVPRPLRGKPEAVLACILAGHEAGVSPMQALAKIHVIEGRPAMSAELMRALVLAAGHELWYDEVTTTRVVACAKRSGSERITRTEYTMDDAKRANLTGKQNWRSFPRQMMTARATGELCRLVFPDVLAGISLTIEEAEDMGDERYEPEVVQSPSVARKATARAKRAATAERSAEPAAIAPAPAGEVPELPDADPVETVVLEAELVDGAEPVADADDDVIDAEVVDAEDDPWPSAEWESADFGEPPPAEAGGRFTGPQLIAIKLADLFGIRGSGDDARQHRLVAIGALLGIDPPASSKELTGDQLRTVLDMLTDWPDDRPLVIPAGVGRRAVEVLPHAWRTATEHDDANDSPATDVPALPLEPATAHTAPAPAPVTAPPHTWRADEWRQFLAARKVKATELLAEARRMGAAARTLDDLTTSPEIVDDLIGWAEDQALNR